MQQDASRFIDGELLREINLVIANWIFRKLQLIRKLIHKSFNAARIKLKKSSVSKITRFFNSSTYLIVTRKRFSILIQIFINEGI